MFGQGKDFAGRQLAPLRSLDDFLLESARFQLPNLKDLEKWGNRVSSNLLYYQTNYFLLSLVIFVVIGVIHPVNMAIGIAMSTVLFSIFWYVTNENTSAGNFKRKHPIISIGLVVTGIYLVMSALNSMLVFFLGILLPLAVAFIHSSLRLRNLKNKLTNQAETLNLRQTPMGIFLKEFGMQPDIF